VCFAVVAENTLDEVFFTDGTVTGGKSAILVGLVVCLGQKARTTERGHNCADLIKLGCPSCVLQVTIKNTGVGAFEPDRYGPSITVVRAIYRSTKASRVHLLNHRKVKVANTGAKDLRRMLDNLYIQVR
jgi:chromosome segregation ATPase